MSSLFFNFISSSILTRLAYIIINIEEEPHIRTKMNTPSKETEVPHVIHVNIVLLVESKILSVAEKILGFYRY